MIIKQLEMKKGWIGTTIGRNKKGVNDIKGNVTSRWHYCYDSSVEWNGVNVVKRDDT